MALKFDITGDNRNLLSSLDGARDGVRRTARAIEESGLSIEDMFKRIGAAVGVAFTFDQAKNFVRSVMEMRGQFQQLEIAFNTMLQSEEKATMLMSQLVETAAKTPFDLQGVAQGAKQLLAYGIAADEVNETITRLGDIAAGLSIPLGDLVYLYGTTMTQGRMFTMDLRQFMGRGIPMAEELAKQFGVTKNEVAGLVTAGQVGADAVKQAIWNMTNEGSRFGGLMAEQSKSITGQISNIEDAFDTMLNDIGKSNEGLINDGLAGVNFLIENYEQVGRVLLGLVTAYGEYKAALMVTSAIQKSMAKQANEIEAARQAELQAVYDQFSSDAEVRAEEASSAAIAQNTASREGNVTAIDSQIADLERKMIAEIEEQNNIYKTAKESLDVLKKQEAQKDSEIETLKEQISTAQEYIDGEKEAMEAALSLGDAEEAEAIKTNIATESKRLETLQEELGVAQKEKNIIADQRHSQTIATKTALTQKQTMQEKLSNMQKAVSVVQTKAQTTATGLWVAVTKSATAAMNSLKAAIMTNPFGVALAAITTLITLLPMFSDEASKASAEVERFGESAVKQTRNLETLFAVVENTSSDSLVHKDAIDELCKIYEEYGFKINDEIDKLEQLRTMHDLVTDAIHREGEERQKANLLQSYNDALEEATTNMRDTLQKAFESAEWDASGTFDDWDAEEYQEKAKELTQIIGAIIQSEGDNLAQLTGDELEAKIQEVNERIKKAYEDMGLQLSKSFVKSGGTQGAQGQTIDAPVDVDAVQIMRDYADAIGSVTKGRTALLESWKKGSESAREETKEVDYSTMSLAELAKEASSASDEVSDLGNQSASPEVDKSSIEGAGTAADTTKGKIDTLNGASAKPFIDTSSIGYAIGQTNTLLGNMFQLQSFGIGGGKSSFSLGFNPNQFGFGKTGQFNLFGGKKPVWGTVGGKQGVLWMPDIPITNSALLAQQELNKRVNGANSQKKVDDLLKEVNEAFDNATFDSDEYKFLQGLKNRLEAKSRKGGGKGGKNGGKGGGKGGNKNDTADKIAREQQKLEDLQDDLDLKRLRFIQDMQTRLTNIRLDLMQDGAEKVRLLQEQQNKEELDNLKRQREDAIREYIDGERRLFEQQESVKKAKNDKYKEKKFDESKVDTSAVAAQYDELIALTEQNQLQASYQESLRAMRDYLKEYGTLEQQRLAITQEYEQKIAEATTPTGRAALMLERNQALKDFDAKQFEEEIDWSGIFSDLQGHTQEYLIGLRDQLQGVLNEGNLTPEQMSVVQEKLRDLNDEISKQNGLFQFQGDRAREYTRLVQEAADAQTRLKQAKKEEADEQKNVLDVTNQIRDMLEGAGIDRDTDIDDEILTQFDANSEEYKQMSKLLEQLRIGEGNLAKARRGTADATKKAKNAEDAKQRESSQAVADWFSDAQQFITEKGIDQIPALLDELGLGDASEKVSQGLAGFNDAAGAATDFASGNYIGAALKGFSAIKNFANMLGFGGDSDKHLQEDIERLTASNEALKYSIDELADKMSESAVADAEAIYKQQTEQLAQSERNTQEMMTRSAAAYSNGTLGIGGHHSSNAKINDNVSSSEWDRISKLIGKNVRSAGEFFNLTSEQMYKVAVELPDVYAHIKDLADNGYKDAAQFMDTYIDYAHQREELEKAYMEKLTSVSFDSIQNEFASALMDMDSDAETFAESFEKYMQQAIINSLVSEQYKPLLEKWYKAFGSFMSDGGISESEMRQLRETGGTYYDPTTGRSESFQSWSSMSDSALTMRDTLKGVFGWNGGDYKQDASSKGFQAMGQDVGEELNGRFTALQIAGESVAAQVISIYSQMQLMTQMQTSSNTCLLEIRDMMVSTNSYLEDMVRYAKSTYVDFGEKIDTMNRHQEEIYNAIRRA